MVRGDAGDMVEEKVEKTKKKKREVAVSLQEREGDPTPANAEETDKGTHKGNERTSQACIEEPVSGRKRKAKKFRSVSELVGSGEVKKTAGVLGDGGSKSKEAKEEKAERRKIKKAKATEEEQCGQEVVAAGGAQVAKKRSKKVRAEANNGEEKRDEIANGGAVSRDDKERADGTGALMSEEKRKMNKTKKVRAMGVAADLGSGHMGTVEGEEEKSSGEKALEKKRKKKKVPVQESRTGMGAGGGEDVNKGLTGVEEPQEGNGDKKQLKKENAGDTGPRGGEKEKRGKKRVMKGEKRGEMGNTQAEEEDVAASVQEERMKKNKKRKAQSGEEDVAVSVQEEEEERMKKNKKKRKSQAGEGDVAVSVQEEEEEMTKKNKKRKAQAGEKDAAVDVEEEEEERMKNKKKRKAQAGEEDVAVSVQEEEEERTKKNKKKRKAQAEGGDTPIVLTKELKEKERADSGSSEEWSASQKTELSKVRRKKSSVSTGEKEEREGGQEVKTRSKGSAVTEEQEGGGLNGKRKKKRRKSDRDTVAYEDSKRTEVPKGERKEVALPSQSRQKQREEPPADEMDVVFLSEKMGNKDEVTIDQERRQALQNEIDKASCPGGTQTLGQWGTAHFENASQQQKFLRLMGGFKKDNKPTGSGEGRATMALGKEGQQRMQQDLLAEFERAQSRWMDFQNRGVGLGFSPQSNKKFFIDVNASRSVRFDD